MQDPSTELKWIISIEKQLQKCIGKMFLLTIASWTLHSIEPHWPIVFIDTLLSISARRRRFFLFFLLIKMEIGSPFVLFFLFLRPSPTFENKNKLKNYFINIILFVSRVFVAGKINDWIYNLFFIDFAEVLRVCCLLIPLKISLKCYSQCSRFQLRIIDKQVRGNFFGAIIHWFFFYLKVNETQEARRSENNWW